MKSFRWVVFICAVAAAGAAAQESDPVAVAHDSSVAWSHHARRLDLMGTIPQGRQEGTEAQAVLESEGQKKPGLAAVYSLLLPGMGELYAGGFDSGKYFLIAEGALWLTYAAFEIRANAMRDDARSFAAVHAGVQPAGKDDDFFVDVGNFMTTEEFNDKVLRDRDPDRLYDRAAGFGWRWDAEESRMAYKDQRLASEDVYNNRKFLVAAVLVNHVASAINAARSAIAHNNALGQLMQSIDLHADLAAGVPIVTLSVRRPL